MPKNYDIQALLDEIHSEIVVASQAFFAWISIYNVAAKDKRIQKALNENALSWNIYLHSLQATFFITIGRIFDTDSRSCSIHLLFRCCKDNIGEFKKKSLKKRKIKEDGKEQYYLKDFINRAYEPSQKDFNTLKKEVIRIQKVYETHFKQVRHRVFAHNNTASYSRTAIIDSRRVDFSVDETEKIVNPAYCCRHICNILCAQRQNFCFLDKRVHPLPVAIF